jgi:hypothetical protein
VSVSSNPVYASAADELPADPELHDLRLQDIVLEKVVRLKDREVTPDFFKTAFSTGILLRKIRYPRGHFYRAD